MKSIKNFFVKIKKNKQLKLISILIVCLLLILIINVSMAYLGAYAPKEGNTPISISTYSVNKFIGDNVPINLTGEDISQNKSITATDKVTLIANDETNSATTSYHPYLIIERNNFTYSINGGPPELLLEITGPNGKITSLPGLAYKTSGGVSGFDVTTKNGIIPLIANDTAKTISTTNTTTGTTDNWQVKITYVNQSGNQSVNNWKEFKSNIIFSQDKISIEPKFNSINVTVPTHLKNGKPITSYTYKIKEASSSNAYSEFPNQTSNTYTFSTLVKETNYSILVEGENGNDLETILNTEVSTITNNLAKYITNYVPTVTSGTGLYHHTPDLQNGAGDNNYRYAGANPDNWVTFNNEDYRIIGVFKDTPESPYRVKLIKDKSIANKAWDDDNLNNWARDATLNTYLNGEWYNSLGEDKNKIEDHKWQIGGINWDNSNYKTNTVKQNYEYELGTQKAPNSTWTGKIGLMYVSDYGYAAIPEAWPKGEDNYAGNTDNDLVIKDNNWMYIKKMIQWTISRLSDFRYYVFRVIEDGNVIDGIAFNSYAIRPVFYLESNVTISSGNGTSSTPYILD